MIKDWMTHSVMQGKPRRWLQREKNVLQGQEPQIMSMGFEFTFQFSGECFQEEGAGRPILPGVGKSGKSGSGDSECCLVFQDLCSGKTQWWRDGIGHGLGGKIFVLLFDIRQTRACFED